jgi:hypothetical protein
MHQQQQKKSRGESAHLVLERRAQPTRVEVPDADLPVRRAGDDRAGTRRARGGRGARAVRGADDVDEDDGLDAFTPGVAAEGCDDLALAQADDAEAALRAADDGERRRGVHGERGDAAQVEARVLARQLEEWRGRARVPVDERVVAARGHDAFACVFRFLVKRCSLRTGGYEWISCSPSGVNPPHWTGPVWPANTCMVLPDGTVARLGSSAGGVGE